MRNRERPTHLPVKDVRVGDFVRIDGKIVEVYGRLFVAGKDIPRQSLEAGWTEPHYYFETSDGYVRVDPKGELERLP